MRRASWWPNILVGSRCPLLEIGLRHEAQGQLASQPNLTGVCLFLIADWTAQTPTPTSLQINKRAIEEQLKTEPGCPKYEIIRILGEPF